jgi:hypothetical protein
MRTPAPLPELSWRQGNQFDRLEQQRNVAMTELGCLLQLFQLMDIGRRLHRSVWKLANRLAREVELSKSKCLAFLFPTLFLTMCAAALDGIGVIAWISGALVLLKPAFLILAIPVSFVAYFVVMLSIACVHQASLQECCSGANIPHSSADGLSARSCNN